MSDRTPQPVQDATTKLIAALALHEDTRDTVESALHDLWDTALNQAINGHGHPDWWCAHHGEDGMDTDKEPWCRGCVEAGITTAPGSAD